MSKLIHSLTFGLDVQDKVHVQVFFEDGTTDMDLVWNIGWVVVGKSPDFGLGIHFGDATEPVVTIKQKSMLKKMVNSIINEGGYHCDTYVGEYKSTKTGNLEIIVEPPKISDWISLTPESQDFFVMVNDMLRGS